MAAGRAAAAGSASAARAGAARPALAAAALCGLMGFGLWAAGPPPPAQADGAAAPAPQVALRVVRLPADDPLVEAHPVGFELAGASGAARPGQGIEVRLRVTAEDGFHIYGPEEKAYYPTFVRAAPGALAKVERVRWPAFVERKGERFYEHGTVIPVELRLAEGIAPGQREVTLDLGFSACNAEECLAPQEWQLVLEIEVEAAP